MYGRQTRVIKAARTRCLIPALRTISSACCRLATEPPATSRSYSRGLGLGAYRAIRQHPAKESIEGVATAILQRYQHPRRDHGHSSLPAMQLSWRYGLKNRLEGPASWVDALDAPFVDVGLPVDGQAFRVRPNDVGFRHEDSE